MVQWSHKWFYVTRHDCNGAIWKSDGVPVYELLHYTPYSVNMGFECA